MGEQQDLVIAATYSWPAEAYLAQGRLDEEGIESFITDEYTVSTNWLYSNAVGGVKVMVNESDVLKAQEILNADESESVMKELGINDDPQVDGRSCPQCGTAWPDVRQARRRSGIIGLLLWFMPVIGHIFVHVPVSATISKSKCANCGYEVPHE